MRTLVRFAGLVLATLPFSVQVAAAQTVTDFRKLCPSLRPQQLNFESLVVNVDSVAEPVTKDRSEIINCVQIAGAKHEYYVDLVGTNLSNVWTRDGGYLAQNDPFVTRDAQYESTLLYLGQNRDQYDVKILKEKSKVAVITDRVLTWLIASLPTRRNQPQDSLQPVALRFEAHDLGETVELAFADQASQGRPLTFRIAESAGPDLGERTFRIGREVTRITYRTPTGPKVIRPTRITFVDSDRRGLAAMDLYLLAPASDQR
ncbi:MAG TPA: hypothetical protein VLX85_11445 [Stellaceae bacterium]|nr:hypothetical protein [Stellaceae bacterium]